MKVLIADKFEKSGLDGLKAAGCDVIFQPDANGDSLIAAIKDSRRAGAGGALDQGDRAHARCGRACR